MRSTSLYFLCNLLESTSFSVSSVSRVAPPHGVAAAGAAGDAALQCSSLRPASESGAKADPKTKLRERRGAQSDRFAERVSGSETVPTKRRLQVRVRECRDVRVVRFRGDARNVAFNRYNSAI